MNGLDHREPGLGVRCWVIAGYAGIIADGIHMHPSLVALAWKLKAHSYKPGDGCYGGARHACGYI